ncbi:MAG: molybdenum cofactor carrier [Chlorobiaceae bacterium]|nr:molybdenum cofactor carrier [Chlorobiaceae bacterium]NTW11183.1 molybdenum cofactor carrier [Chlorobiaceae bacterium]
MLKKIVSGGQSGVDRAALDAAIAAGIEHGGWCPRDRRAEDGAIPERYRLAETPQKGYRQRTAWNVRDSDGTLILVRKSIKGGTRYTLQCAAEAGRPSLVFNPDFTAGREEVERWLENYSIGVLNIAGPRASSDPDVYLSARNYLHALFSAVSRRK